MNYLERRKLTFKVVTPFFIASGDDYYSIDYVIDNNLKVIDKDSFNKRVLKDKKLMKIF